jgi:hypothetical protein
MVHANPGINVWGITNRRKARTPITVRGVIPLSHVNEKHLGTVTAATPLIERTDFVIEVDGERGIHAEGD